MAGAEAPAISWGVEVESLEYELQSELNLSRALRSAVVSKVRVAGGDSRAWIEGTVRRSAVEGVDGPVEEVQRVHAELQPFAFGDREAFVEREIHVGVARTANVADAA